MNARSRLPNRCSIDSRNRLSRRSSPARLRERSLAVGVRAMNRNRGSDSDCNRSRRRDKQPTLSGGGWRKERVKLHCVVSQRARPVVRPVWPIREGSAKAPICKANYTRFCKSPVCGSLGSVKRCFVSFSREAHRRERQTSVPHTRSQDLTKRGVRYDEYCQI